MKRPEDSRRLFDPRDPRPAPSATASASWRPGSWSRTRSCSWSRSAASLTTLLLVRDLVRHGKPGGAALVHGRRSRSGCGSRCSSPTSPRRWPRGAARPRPPRCARCARRSRRGALVDGQAGKEERCRPRALRKGDLVVVEAGELIPGDGEIVEGIASVDESAITGESAPVIRESGGDRSAVTGGTQGALRPHRRRDHRQPGRVVPRSDDRAGRGRRRARRRPTRSRCTSCSSA